MSETEQCAINVHVLWKERGGNGQQETRVVTTT